MSETTTPAWRRDVELTTRIADETTRILGLSAASRATLADVLHVDDAASPVGSLERDRRIADLAAELVPALRRHGVRSELVGLTDLNLAQVLQQLRRGGDPRAVPSAPLLRPTKDDRRAVVGLIGQFSPELRKRLFRTSSMLPIGLMVRVALAALDRRARQQQR